MPAQSRKVLTFISFDFDETVTTKHTWKEVGIKSVTPETLGLAQGGAIPFADAHLLARLIEGVCSQRVIFCFTSMQFAQIVYAALCSNAMLKHVVDKYQGSYFFIIGRKEIQMAANKDQGSKPAALRKWFTPGSSTNLVDAKNQKINYSGIHFDDDDRERAKFNAEGIQFQVMAEKGAGFNTGLQSTLMAGFKNTTANFFTNIGAVKLPEEPIYANVGSLSSSSYSVTEVPEFNFGMRSSTHDISLGTFVTNVIVQLVG